MKIRPIAQALSVLVLAGAVSASAQTAPFVRTVIVPSNSTATANGTALLTALAGLSPAPSFTNRWLIKLEPGIYNVGGTPVVLSPYVDIEGSGVLESIIQGAYLPPFPILTGGLVQGASNSEIRSLTINCVTTSGSGLQGCQAFSLTSATDTRLSQVRILAQGTGTGNHWAVRTYDSTPIFDDIEIQVSTTGSNNYGIVHAGQSALNLLRSNVAVFGASNDNVGIMLRDGILWSQMRDSSVTAHDGATAMAIAYNNISTSSPLFLDDAIVSAHSGTNTTGIGSYSGFPSVSLFIRGGRLYSSGDGVDVKPNADLTISHTEIEAQGLIGVQGNNITYSFTRLIGTGVFSAFGTAACSASVDVTGTFLPNACP